MKRILAIIMAVLALVAVLASCNETTVTKVGDVQENEEKYSMFVVVEETADWRVVYHRETGVMYVTNSRGSSNRYFELLVDEDGWPLLWEGSE